MIGVVADPSDRAVIREFFELFKTPWEFYESGRRYDVLLCAGTPEYLPEAANVTLLYSSDVLYCDVANQLEVSGRREATTLALGESNLPIYGKCLLFQASSSNLFRLNEEASGQAALTFYSSQNGRVVRIGYDLFHEIRHLLTFGQPVEFSGIPTLELHIQLVRELIISTGVTLAEIPAIPEGYKFIVCLTHDVDHPSIRKHSWDRTAAGFFYRATVGSLWNFLRHSISLRELLANLAAATRLPLVYLGLAKDFWRDFVHRYQELEKGCCSTYFVIPFQGRRGREGAGLAPAYRAAQYGADDIADLIAEMTAGGDEVGLHGIDSWIDSSSGKEELHKIQELTGAARIGSRMHWLFFNEKSPALLEQAGIFYDSTCGYRETVGFRAGTTQAYKPLEAERLLELPLHVMDTALFYPAYLGLTSTEATRVLERLANFVDRFGGCLTINWHDRSLAPERLWHACYRQLLNDLKARGVWFATATEIVAWFRKRRSVVFEGAATKRGSSATDGLSDDNDQLPELRLRIHNSPLLQGRSGQHGFVDVCFSQDAILQMASGNGQ